MKDYVVTLAMVMTANVKINGHSPAQVYPAES